MLAGVMKAEGQAIIYRRGRLSLSITANPDAANDPVQVGDGFSIGFGERDFAMDSADLGEFGLPVDGDLIQWTSAGTTYVYKVLPNEDSRCFDWLDNRNLRLAAHTKLMHTA